MLRERASPQPPVGSFCFIGTRFVLAREGPPFAASAAQINYPEWAPGLATLWLCAWRAENTERRYMEFRRIPNFGFLGASVSNVYA